MADEDEGQRKRKPRRGRKPPKEADGQDRANLISAIAHPLRRRMLRLLQDRDEPLSPVGMAKTFGLPVGTTAYHARVLCRLGALAPAGERQVRGAVEHFYDSTIESDPPIETLLEETREVDEEDA